MVGTKHSPLWQEVVDGQHAIPNKPRSYRSFSRGRSAEAALPGLRFCANYRGGVSMGDCNQDGGCKRRRHRSLPAGAGLSLGLDGLNIRFMTITQPNRLLAFIPAQRDSHRIAPRPTT